MATRHQTSAPSLPPEVWAQIASLLPYLRDDPPRFAWNNYRHVNQLFKHIIEDYYVQTYCPWIQERDLDTPQRAADRRLTRESKLQSFHGALLRSDVEPVNAKGKGRAVDEYPTVELLREKRRARKKPSTNRLIFGSDTPRRDRL